MGKRIVVVGAGAVGSYTGAHMAKAGEDVTFIDFWPENVAAINRDGIRVTHHQGPEPFSVKCKALHLTEAQQFAKQAPVDIAFVCVKSYDTEWAARLIQQYLAPGGYIVSLQNCMNEETIAGVVGWGKVMGCIASHISVALHAPAQVHRGGLIGGDRHIVYRTGEPNGRITERAHEVRRLVSTADSAKVTDNLWGERWTKLVQNTMANGFPPAPASPGRNAPTARRSAISRRDSAARRSASARRAATSSRRSITRSRKRSPAPARATPRRWQNTITTGSTRRAALRISARRWARTWPRAAAPRSSSSMALSCARAMRSAFAPPPTSASSTSSKKSSAASSNRTRGTSASYG